MSESVRFLEVRDALAPRMAERHAGFWSPDGWLDLVVETDAQLRSVNPDYRIAQVKEKFGGLCFYVDRITEPMKPIIRDAEAKSYTICQNCGSGDNVSLVNHGWVATLCETCETTSDRWQGRGY